MMKRCLKLQEPPTLATYRQANPQATWGKMKNDPFHNGQQTAIDVKLTLVSGQRCLCAYCELSIADGTAHQTIYARRSDQRVEHFHPKSDLNNHINWHLQWSNLWAVCHGGSAKPAGGAKADPKTFLPPIPGNLSCDAYKDHQIVEGKLNADPKGWILAPDELPNFPLLFQFSYDGIPKPHVPNCANCNVLGNHHADTAALVAETIAHLNLGCNRLTRAREAVLKFLEQEIKTARDASPNSTPQVILQALAQKYFSQNSSTPWPEFFTLIRWRLGQPAEDHLQSINYVG